MDVSDFKICANCGAPASMRQRKCHAKVCQGGGRGSKSVFVEPTQAQYDARQKEFDQIDRLMDELRIEK